ncbi:MAG: hypothetical protein KCHDKBKB_01873 [Elusimicrobia bacterium]|nr:hypothetical protein [Elusimicrobiota bacterium]
MVGRLLFSIGGILAGLMVPFSWFLWRAFSSRHEWWMAFLKKEMSHHHEIYICTGLFSVMIFSIVGYLLGKKNDDLRLESKNVEDSNRTLNHLATTDGLTGLFNARYMNDRMNIEIEGSRISPLTCLLVDVDHFKRINDGYGHPFGDEVLVRVAQIMKQSARRIDPVGRMGGEEFLVLLPGAPCRRAQEIAQKIRRDVSNEPFLFEGKPVHVTVSVGLATCPSIGISNQSELLHAVDEALYSAKRSGRNRVVAWKPPQDQRKAA